MRLSEPVTFQGFTPDVFKQRVYEFSRRRPGNEDVPQVLYLSNYLDKLGARSLIIEPHYIDRHYIEEFSLYYARCFSEYPNYCSRLHLFRSVIDRERILSVLEHARNSQDELQRASAELSADYLGYVVVRPIPAVPIGRTVLRTLEDDPKRCFTALLEYRVHLAGLELTVRGLAFQQQDIGVSACATTAIWTALQRVAKQDGARALTPSQVTEFAVKYSVHHRAYPQTDGLAVEQMCEAIRSAGFAPDVFMAEEAPGALPFALHASLGSGIPSILLLLGESSGHAVTAVGYRLADGKPAPSYSIPAAGISFDCPAVGIETLYVHDDSVGPYASAQLVARPPSWATSDEAKRRSPFSLLMRLINNEVEEQGVFGLLSALYPKIRMAPLELYANSALFARLLATKVKLPLGEKLSLEAGFVRAGEYSARLLLYRQPVDETLAFFERATFSRYVGITRFMSGRRPLFEAVWDTTDTCKSGCLDNALLGAVCFWPPLKALLKPLVVDEYKSLLL